MDRDLEHLGRALQIALEAESQGNLPIGCVLVLDGQRIAEGWNAVLLPEYHPGRHAEMQALSRVEPALWPRAAQMTCYTTLEPCLMCFGSLLVHGIGRIVFGAVDPEGGSGSVLPHLPPYYVQGRKVPEWVGPLLQEDCDPLYQRLRLRFDGLPCGKYG